MTSRNTSFAREFRALHGHWPGPYGVEPARPPSRPRDTSVAKALDGVPWIGKVGLLVALSVAWIALAALLVVGGVVFGLFVWEYFRT